jgi:hypothetical protein
MASKIFPLIMLPGIQRDGTDFSAEAYIDGQWCRFYRGLPQKMGGYDRILGSLVAIPRGTFVLSDAPNFNVYTGDAANLKYVPIDSNGLAVGAQVDRTPSLFAADNNNKWTFDVIPSTVDNSGILIAHAAPNLSSIDQRVERPVYYGDLVSTSALTSTGFEASGGIVVLHPYLFIFGNDGNVIITNANDPTSLFNEARVTGSKIVAGMATRGGNSSPAGLLWSVDSLIRVTQVGTTSVEFAFDAVTSSTSILSSNGIVEYDGLYYWAGADRFLVYNGVVNEVPNSMSLEFFFNNVNMAQRQKVWATKFPKYGEIWWFYPKGNATECNHAVIYNVREQVWYDTPIERGSGDFNQTFDRPIWTSNTVDGGGTYAIWQHEIGSDQTVNEVRTAIESYFETSPIAWVGSGPDKKSYNLEKTVSIDRIEPDFVQTGEMTVIAAGRDYARSPNVSSPTFTFEATTEKIDMRVDRRELTLKFSSNVVGGDYKMGKVLMEIDFGDTRP